MFRVRDIMSTEVFVLHAEQSLAMVRYLMKLKHIRHIPIVSPDDRFVGLLTHRDLLSHTVSRLAGIDEREQEEIDQNIPIREVMKTEVEVTSPDAPLNEVIPILLSHKYGCLPVVSEGKLVGIITEADFLRLTLDLLQKHQPA